MEEAKMIDFREYIENYLNPKEPVCREERQFALFLYQKLFDMIGMTKEEMKKIDDSYTRVRKACGLSETDIIKSVYYEVTFMRDFFHRDKEKKSYTFNEKLFSFVYNIFKEKEFEHLFENCSLDSFKYCEETDCKKCGIKNNAKHIICKKINYGSNSEKTKTLNDILPIKYFVRAMMNSKPDLGIIYEDADKKLHLRFLECKDESSESPIKLFDEKVDNMKKKELASSKSFVMTQTVIQYYISKFICDISINIQSENPILVKFDKDYESLADYKVNKWYLIPKDLQNVDNSILTNLKCSRISYADILPSKIINIKLS